MASIELKPPDPHHLMKLRLDFAYWVKIVKLICCCAIRLTIRIVIQALHKLPTVDAVYGGGHVKGNPDL